jgi:hypothetical protein
MIKYCINYLCDSDLRWLSLFLACQHLNSGRIFMSLRSELVQGVPVFPCNRCKMFLHAPYNDFTYSRLKKTTGLESFWDGRVSRVQFKFTGKQSETAKGWEICPWWSCGRQWAPLLQAITYKRQVSYERDTSKMLGAASLLAHEPGSRGTTTTGRHHPAAQWRPWLGTPACAREREFWSVSHYRVRSSESAATESSSLTKRTWWTVFVRRL